jgi:GntR family transcriptional regulator/MocR family aminotransferase
MLENALAELFKTGVLQRHLRKSVRVYKQRRDTFCELMRTHLNDYVNFQVPDGGMAVWTRFDPAIDLKALAAKALQKDLYFSDGSASNLPPALAGGVRLGFASSNQSELEESVEIMTALI